MQLEYIARERWRRDGKFRNGISQERVRVLELNCWSLALRFHRSFGTVLQFCFSPQERHV
jgi:hypothetical protein